MEYTGRTKAEQIANAYFDMGAGWAESGGLLRDLREMEQGYLKRLADAQATVEALQARVQELEALNAEVHSKIDRQDELIEDLQFHSNQRTAELEALQKDNRTYIDERHENMKQIEALQSQLSQLQALVREMPCFDGEIKVKTYHHESDRGQEWDEYECGDAGFDNLEAAHVYAALLRYRATLDATTPARMGSNIREEDIGKSMMRSKGGDGE